MHKRIVMILLSVSMLTMSIPMNAYAMKSQVTIEEKQEDVNDKITDSVGAPVGNVKTVNDILAQSKFTTSQGHGFAAECANNLADNIKGKNAVIVGNDNMANGPDRKIINRDGTVTWIQDKYYMSAKASIDACFDELGAFRYLDGDGNPMQIEVPKEQYAEAVEYMRKKIEDGKIPKVTNPDEAETLVRKGAITYKQAQNLAKVGTIESLTYDAINGTVSATWSAGITTLVNYSVCRMNGMDSKKALKASVEEGLKSGMMEFGTAVIAGQLSKTGLVNAFKPQSEALVKKFGPKFEEVILSTAGKTFPEGGTASTMTSRAAKVLRTQALVTVVSTIVFSVPDVVDMFNGRISKKQFVKNFAVTAVSIVAGTAGGAAGGFVGNLMVPGVGTIPGSVVGSILVGGAGGFLADLIADYITDDDAEEMYKIIQNTFAQYCEDYMVSEEEAENIASEFTGMLNDDMYKDMYQSENREQYAEQILIPVFENEVEKRANIELPTEQEMRELLLSELEGIVFVH